MQKESMETKPVKIIGTFATLDHDGNIKDLYAGKDMKGLDMFCENISGTEIDGVRFDVSLDDSDALITMTGEDLSDQIYPNFPKKSGGPLMQIKPKDPDGKRTALVLNKFIMRITKMLEKEPFNKKRRFKASTILLREVLEE